ncbi:MAG: hypothetical protein IJ164_00190 [Duodenibacillus sp.]|nr:hypothetical protein [Duodenibacillus sp.]
MKHTQSTAEFLALLLISALIFVLYLPILPLDLVYLRQQKKALSSAEKLGCAFMQFAYSALGWWILYRLIKGTL